MICFKSKTYDIYRESNHKLSDYMRAWKQQSNTITATSGRDSCHVLQSLIFMILSHMERNRHRWRPVQFMIFFDFDISAWMLQFCIWNLNRSSHSVYTDTHKKMKHDCAHIFKGSECCGGAYSQWNFNINTISPLWKNDCH